MASKNFSLGLLLGATVSPSLKSSFDTSKKGIDQIQAKISSLNAIKVKLRSENMTSDVSAQLKQVRREIVNLKKEAIIKLRINGLKESLSEQKASLIALGATAYGISKPLSSRADVEKSQGQLASLGVSEEGIGKVTTAAEEYVKRYAGTSVPEFIAASYDLKSGIASLSDEGIASFATLSAKTASATKSSVGTINKVVALGYGIFRSQFASDDAFINKFTAASARAVQAFRTDGDDLALGLSNVGASAASMGVKLEEQLAILGVAKSSFNSMAEAGTGYRAFLSNVGEAQKDLGLTFVDSAGHMLPMVEILAEIKNKFEDLSELKNSDALKKAFGSDEAVKFIKGLIDKQDELVQSQKDINKEMNNGTELVDQMANAMQRGQGFTLMSQNISILSSKIGLVFMPAATLGAKAIGKLTEGIGWFIDTFPNISAVIGGGVMTFFSLAAAVKVATLSQLLFSLASTTLQLGILKSVGLTQLWTGVQWALNAAMTANPIGLVIAGIGALVALGVTLYNSWKPFHDLWDSIFGSSSSSNTKLSNNPQMQLADTNNTAIASPYSIPTPPQGAAKSGNNNSVSVTIQNPSFNSPEEASRTQAQIDEQVRKALREMQRDQADRSYSD